MGINVRLLPALRALARGGLIAYPTEAIYGIGCDPLDPDAVSRLLQAKRRRPDKGLILLAAGQAQLADFLQPLAPEWHSSLDATWPGPVTGLVPAAGWVPAGLSGRRETLAVRVTDHPVAAALCRAWGGPLISTSANRSGAPPARTALQARLRLGPELDAIVAGPTGGLRQATEIRDIRTGRILRPGA